MNGIEIFIFSILIITTIFNLITTCELENKIERLEQMLHDAYNK